MFCRVPGFPAYLDKALRAEPFPLGGHFLISGAGRLEAVLPNGSEPRLVRLQTRAVVRALTRAARAGIPVGPATREWLQAALRSPDFRAEAEECLRRNAG